MEKNYNHERRRTRGNFMPLFIIMYFKLSIEGFSDAIHHMNKLYIHESIMSLDVFFFKLRDGIIVCVIKLESASTTCVLRIHHLLEVNSYSHCNLQSIAHSPLRFEDSKQHSMWLMHPAAANSTPSNGHSKYFM